jgi:hypothetical protein
LVLVSTSFGARSDQESAIAKIRNAITISDFDGIDGLAGAKLGQIDIDEVMETVAALESNSSLHCPCCAEEFAVVGALAPTLLDCGHVICQADAANAFAKSWKKQKLRCPVKGCKKKTIVPEGDIMLLPLGNTEHTAAMARLRVPGTSPTSFHPFGGEALGANPAYGQYGAADRSFDDLLDSSTISFGYDAIANNPPSPAPQNFLPSPAPLGRQKTRRVVKSPKLGAPPRLEFADAIPIEKPGALTLDDGRNPSTFSLHI